MGLDQYFVERWNLSCDYCDQIFIKGGTDKAHIMTTAKENGWRFNIGFRKFCACSKCVESLKDLGL